jgi:uncharacterized protein
MNVYVDTSAFLAILDHQDMHHVAAQAKFQEMAHINAALTCTNYVLVESLALIQRRLGMQIIQHFHQKMLPIVKIFWVEEQLHQIALINFLASNRRKLSFVDCVSFAAMRQLNIDRYFAFDEHFIKQGFVSV